MDDIDMRMMELSARGLGCSQILMLMALEERGESNTPLVRAMTGLLGGMFCGKTCGALSGGCCVLGLYAGGGDENEIMDDRLPTMLGQLTGWFDREFGERYGGTDCSAILADPALRTARCPDIVGRTFRKVLEILEDNGIRPDGQE